MNEKVIGKKIKLNDFNMTYGKQEKLLNVICLFKYKKDNNIYAIYCDDSSIPYGIIYYGSAHIKGNTLIVIGSKVPNQEMLKEILFKINNNEQLENFEILELSQINLIEIVSPNKFEIKKEILQNLIDKTMPKPIVPEKKTQKKNKKPQILPILLILIVLTASLYFFIFKDNTPKENIVKSFICKKEYQSNELEAKVIEDNTYNFNQNDILQYINKSTTYKFYKEEEYYDFINKGIFYSYIPEEYINKNPEDNSLGYRIDNDTYSLIIIEKEDTTKDYFLPTEYEEVLSHYKEKGYSCTE